MIIYVTAIHKSYSKNCIGQTIFNVINVLDTFISHLAATLLSLNLIETVVYTVYIFIFFILKALLKKIVLFKLVNYLLIPPKRLKAIHIL